MKKICASHLFQSLLCIVSIFACPFLVAAERSEVRMLLDFENPADLDVLKKRAESVDLDLVQDNGVTSGKNCCRVVAKEGSYGVLLLDGELAKNWGNFEYFAMDVFSDRTEKVSFAFELWDKASTNYATRCTYEGALHEGANPMLWRIDKSKRNNKEGISWEEAQPKDKINFNELKYAKIFFAAPKGGVTRLWIDKLRLLQEDAVGAKVKVALPASARAFEFGGKGKATAGFTWIGPTHESIHGAGVEIVGKAWPDALTGQGLYNPKGAFTFETTLPEPGEYCVWLSAGKLFRPEAIGRGFQLSINDTVVLDEKLTAQEFYGEKGVFRYLHTQASRSLERLWADYVEPEAPVYKVKIKSGDGKLRVQSAGLRLAALVVMPAKEETAFETVAQSIADQRRTLFLKSTFLDKVENPKREAKDGALRVWIPNRMGHINPVSSPNEKEAGTFQLVFEGAPGQRYSAQLAVTAFEDLGTAELEISELKGPSTIPTAAFRTYYQNYRFKDGHFDEMGLLPWTKIKLEANTTWSYWLWLGIPKDAAPGTYTGTATVKTEKGGNKAIPISLEVYPIKLNDELPLSLGMYYEPIQLPDGLGLDRKKVVVEQLKLMREMGFTATTIAAGRVDALENQKVKVKFNPLMFEAAKEAGMGRNPGQLQMGNSLGMARGIARYLLASKGGGSKVDQDPGVELKLPELAGYYKDALNQYREYCASFKLPVGVEVVDEPREMPNPWNRTAKDTAQYADWMKEAGGIQSFVTFMGDENSGKDYTFVTDHIDIISVHATPGSKKLIDKSRLPGKTLWLYNNGMDRLSWGFYNWRMSSKGRWEWHWCFLEDAGDTVPNPDTWYHPFTGKDAYTLHAPYMEYPTGCLFKSVFLRAAEGITDQVYVYTLEQALKAAEDNAAKAALAKEASEFLASVKSAIPEFPGVKGMASPDSGALVGQGLDTPVQEMSDPWRKKIAGYLIQLQK